MRPIILEILNSCYRVLFSLRAEAGEETAARAILSIVARAVAMAISMKGIKIAAIGNFGLWMLPLGCLV